MSDIFMRDTREYFMKFADQSMLENHRIGREGEGFAIPKMKPCPFCGRPAEIKIQKHIPKGNDWTPRCTDPSCAGRLTKKWTDREIAIAAWNRREEMEG